jgi:hypothetical protein
LDWLSTHDYEHLVRASTIIPYGAREISAGAVAARLRTDNVPGIRAVPGSSIRGDGPGSNRSVPPPHLHPRDVEVSCMTLVEIPRPGDPEKRPLLPHQLEAW